MSNLHPIFEEILKPFEPKHNAVREAMDSMYNLAIDHAIATVLRSYPDLPGITELIDKLKALKKCLT